jgi:dienelactone hydrolase
VHTSARWCENDSVQDETAGAPVIQTRHDQHFSGPLAKKRIPDYKLFMKLLLPFLVFGAVAFSAHSEIKTRLVEYRHGDTVLEGYLAYDDAQTGKRPGVLIVHQWKGLTDYEKGRAEMLARMGYVAFAADIYGKGIRPTTTQEAGAEAGKYKKNRPLLRERVRAGWETLKAQPSVDGAKTAAIGYCFGGTSVLELARSGAEVGGVVSFHGGLDSPAPEDAKNIKAKVLVLHGADDPFIPEAEFKAFQEEMRQAKVNWQLISYGGAVHSFTEKRAGDMNIRGAAYNADADRRSWEHMRLFFSELFQ